MEDPSVRILWRSAGRMHRVFDPFWGGQNGTFSGVTSGGFTHRNGILVTPTLSRRDAGRPFPSPGDSDADPEREGGQSWQDCVGKRRSITLSGRRLQAWRRSKSGNAP